VFHELNVGAINWGLVSGRTNTIYPWGSPEGAEEPNVRFHDVFRRDDTPFDQQEIDLLRQHTKSQIEAWLPDIVEATRCETPSAEAIYDR
jgi:hypothetical protein